jgi:hypothetical protein
LYVLQVGSTTGDLDIHDVAVDANGRVIFINTLFGCLSTTSEKHSFVPLWRLSSAGWRPKTGAISTVWLSATDVRSMSLR